MIFYLGTHDRSWLWRLAGVPLMVSRNRLSLPGRLHPATTRWVMDSGGFTELSQHGGWRITARQYADQVNRYIDEIGEPDWVAPQDWMCEPFILEKTGKTVAEHQRLTIENYCHLRELDVPVIPVLQGYDLRDYERCANWYTAAEVDLAIQPVVGLGSICRRQNSDDIGRIVVAMLDRGLHCHGFGCKAGAIRRYGDMLTSADSLAWSFGGRRNGTCTHLKSRCANHLHWALDWRTSLLDTVVGGTVQRALQLIDSSQP